MGELLEALGRERAVAILRTLDETAVRPALEAVVEAGFRFVEITLNTPRALEAARWLASLPDVVAGMGTVLEPDDVRRAHDAGVRFVVSPVFDPRVVSTALELGLVPIPGTFSPTEMLAAFRAGAPIQKLFPAPSEGPEFVRALLGPMPFLRILPTSGVTLENAPAFLEGGAFAVGFVRALFVPEELEARAFSRVGQRAREALARVRATRVSRNQAP